LTGLPNRRALYEYYEKLEKDSSVHIMLIDIDNFKRVNDSYGHTMGDRLLCFVSDILRDKLGSNGIFRIGGDEFVAIIDGKVSEEVALEDINDIRRALKEGDFRRDVLSLISLSIGIVIGQHVSQMLDEVLNKCDSAMYHAKSDGKNKFIIYKTLEKIEESNRDIESDMEEALQRGDFQAYLQPKVNMINSTLYGAEALARWVHPVDGVRSPAQFIPLFEKNGFITTLDFYIFEEVCRMKSEYVGTPLEHLQISVNMSRLHLYHRDFPKKLKSIADKYGVPTGELEIEITESTFFKDSTELIFMVEKLRQYGFMVSIDDFGSGYSALNMLKDIPVETIKIDKEFLRLSSNNYKGKKVIRNIIIMCKELKLNIVAEGVETKEQIDFLIGCGCEVAQGYVYARPMTIDEFLKYAGTLAQNSTRRVEFTFDGTLKSSDGEYEGTYRIDSREPVEYTFVPGIFKGKQAIHFPGGRVERNALHLPKDVIKTESFTVDMWVYTDVINPWTAVLYVKMETGFIALVPNAWEGHATFRLRDSKDYDGWYDTAGCQFPDKRWVHTAITYNAKTETAIFYYNGEVLATRDEIPTQRFVTRVIVGGDAFQRSYVGSICNLTFYSEVMSPKQIEELYNSYISHPDFVADSYTE